MKRLVIQRGSMIETKAERLTVGVPFPSAMEIKMFLKFPKGVIMLPVMAEASSSVSVFSFSLKRKIQFSKQEMSTKERKKGARICDRAMSIIVAVCSFLPLSKCSPKNSMILDFLIEAAIKARMRVTKR
jgi:hypothetical protein